MEDILLAIEDGVRVIYKDGFIVDSKDGSDDGIQVDDIVGFKVGAATVGMTVGVIEEYSIDGRIEGIRDGVTRGDSDEGIVVDISDGKVVVMIEGCLSDDGVIERVVVDTNDGTRDRSSVVA